jgi:membrane protein implicated in regulation of membrane protease activity
MIPNWGLWLILAFVLLIVEVSAPAFVSLFFGLAALLVALICWLAGPDLPSWAAWVIFVGLAVVLLLTLRSVCRRVFVGKQSAMEKTLASEVVGQKAVVTVRIQPGQPGKVELRGANWRAEAGETLEPGVQVLVVKQESITLTVERVA